MAVYSVDRIEGDYAVLVGEDKSNVTVSLDRLPAGIKEGNVLRFEGGAYSLDSAEEQQRRSRILALQEKLCRKNR